MREFTHAQAYIDKSLFLHGVLKVNCFAKLSCGSRSAGIKHQVRIEHTSNGLRD